MTHTFSLHFATAATKSTSADSSTASTVAVIAAVASILVALLAGFFTYAAAKRQVRRDTFSAAVRAAVAWKEMVYRVRRRGSGDAPRLIEEFHKLQDELAYYEAWVAIESPSMAKSYRRLVKAVKSKTEDLIREAWDAPIRPVPGNAIDSDVHPDVSADTDAFLEDIRDHMSIWFWPRLQLRKRNRD